MVEKPCGVFCTIIKKRKTAHIKYARTSCANTGKGEKDHEKK